MIPKEHHPCFDAMPEALPAEGAATGQRVARALKAIHGVERVGFAFTGTDVPHAHAYVAPLAAADDLTLAALYRRGRVDLPQPACPPGDVMARTARRIREKLEG